MVFLLNRNNVFEYLENLGYRSDNITNQIEPVVAKNFNLLISTTEDSKLLVKQERHNRAGKTVGEFLAESQVHQLAEDFPALNYWKPSISELLHFDRDNSILVFRYLQDYRDLSNFYNKENIFDDRIAQKLGTVLASFHRDTYHRAIYRLALRKERQYSNTSIVKALIRSLEHLTPEIFGIVPDEGLKFYTLYQRYDSLGQALVELGDALKACCLTHNDLKLNNILLHDEWKQPESQIIRIIDWERAAWGDPAFDLGTLIASYLQMWLGSLVVSKSLSIEESLSLAITPLDLVRPSIAALIRAYLQAFPDILIDRPDFLVRVIQFTGLGLIQGIQAGIDYQKTLGNSGIAQLQVAKSLLCRPEQSMLTVFGMNFSSQVSIPA
ncbi:phosphotransferase [Chamaesiphon polymorphus]|uniref:LPS biosynthesis choline kinase n=1 Tax=Chamaesiphon polymorphus CCALA 037 TaxID=2107692 RepID=A0A2T1GFY7_9CYAN|nr:phosphotransferase [Chamaesiphon polymorphus]PSB56546.1 LPS biosynthesis choline kinase [Chamaesiphon polymorphus CCALA 037]